MLSVGWATERNLVGGGGGGGVYVDCMSWSHFYSEASVFQVGGIIDCPIPSTKDWVFKIVFTDCREQEFSAVVNKIYITYV